ncbi:uL15 family ribosomal protein [Candidatus Woesearchaeota archaeon]|nr:uL15 family ribosomal protein [Candidatus Woesearchaeota archaeon]
MVVRRKRKVVRQRGSGTHGWGSKKKHRGAGSRGGRGASGTGKKCESRKPSIWKNTRFLGKYGFKRNVVTEDINTINISMIEAKLNSYLNTELVQKEKDIYKVNLEKLGYNKLLGSGRVSKKFEIVAKYASKSAVEKVKAAGGEVVLPAEQRLVDAEIERRDSNGKEISKKPTRATVKPKSTKTTGGKEPKEVK